MLRTVVYIALLAVTLRHVVIIAMSLGFHKTVYNHKPGKCQVVPGIANGSEDIELLSDGLALITSGFPTLKQRQKDLPAGHIYVFDMNEPEVKVKRLKVTGKYDPGDLHPHGLSSFEDKKSGNTYVFVVNHLVGYDVIEIFQFDRKSLSLEFVRTARDPAMKSMNDVVAVSEDEFYFTNDGRSLHPGIRLIEQLLRLRTGGLFYCDVTTCRQLGESLLEPNGIELSRNGRYLFVSQPFRERVQIYEKAADGGDLLSNEPIQTITLGTTPDNVFVDDVGDLWIGCHPVGIKTVEHLDDVTKLAPSQVIRVKFHPSEEPFQKYDLDEVYSEDGRNISMSSTAVFHQNRLLIGTVRTNLLHCTVDAV